MDNTTQQYALVLPYVLDPRINQPKTQQANAVYTALFSLQNSYLRHVTRVFCADVIRHGFVVPATVRAPLPHRVIH